MAGRARTIVAFVLGATLLIGAVACGGKSEAEQAEELILGAAEATFGAGTAQVALDLEGLGAGVGQVDFEASQSQLEFDGDDGPSSVWLDGTDLLVGQDDVVGRVDYDDLTRLQALIYLFSPIPAVQLLNGLTGDIDIVGDDTVDGVDATHYAITVDADAVLAALDGDDRRVMQLVLDALGLDEVDLDVWLDADGRVVQLQAVVDLGDGRTFDITLGLTDFGDDVRIRIPRPNQVLDPEEFELVTADVAGTYSGTTEYANSTDTAVWANGQPEEATIVLRCRPDGTCRNRESGSTWEASAPGTYTVTNTFLSDCVDDAGNVTTPGGFEEAITATWTATAAEDGQVTEITETGTLEGRVTAAGLADGCALPGGGTTGSVQLRGVVTRQ